MNRKKGFYGIGIEGSKFDNNIGILFRSAVIMGADFIFTIGKRYSTQPTDTLKSKNSIPYYNYDNFEDFWKYKPENCELIGVELHNKSIKLNEFIHPKRSIYLLGAEDTGLSQEAQNRCSRIIQIPSIYDISLNVSVAGSLIMYDRFNKIFLNKREVI